jgi:hypothetical protein
VAALKERGHDLTIHVRPDGRVEMYEQEYATRYHRGPIHRADTDPSWGDQKPSAAIQKIISGRTEQ